jgi:hypothetical protein
MNPVTLVATVVARKSAFQPFQPFAVSSPNTTTNPETIPTKLNKTCMRVRMVMPKITFTTFSGRLLSVSGTGYAVALTAAPLKNASRSALIWSALVVGMPCGKPG